MASIVTLQEANLRGRAEEDRNYGDLLYFYGARRDMGAIDALLSDIDPKNEADMLLFELYQGTGAKALLPLVKADTAPWVRYSLLKALLRDGAFESALEIWKKALQWQNPDMLMLNTLVEFGLNNSRFDDVVPMVTVARKLAPKWPGIDGWHAQVTSKTVGTKTLHLDPLPSEAPVAFFLSTQDAAPYLEHTLSGIAAQSHPVAEIIVVNDGGMELEALQRHVPFRILDGGEGGLPDDIDAEYFAMVPHTAAPAVDYIQQFLLALDNGPSSVARLSGRIEDFYQDSPGDRWRVIRMTSDMPQNWILAPDAPSCGATFRPRSAPAAGDTFYLPEAVACGLRQDTVDSAMAAFWQEHLPQRQQAGHFQEGVALIRSFKTHLERTIKFINDDVDQGRSSLVFADFLFLFHGVAMDAQLAVAQGIFDQGTAAYVQQEVIQSISALDKEYKRDVVKKVSEALKDRLVKTTAPPNATPEITQALATFVQELNALYNGVPQDLYLAING